MPSLLFTSEDSEDDRRCAELASEDDAGLVNNFMVDEYHLQTYVQHIIIMEFV